MTCETCYQRPPRPASGPAVSLTIEAAPRSRVPLLSFGWAPYPDDEEHGTLYLEVGRPDAQFDDPGEEWLAGGVGRGDSHGPFDWREVLERAPRARLRDLAADGDLDAPDPVERREGGGIWMA